jgi:parallel beta-helix repeat protein
LAARQQDIAAEWRILRLASRYDMHCGIRHRARRLAIVCFLAGAAAIPATALGGGGGVGCGSVLYADTTLHADILDCAGDGLVIGADGITVNLNGHVVDGSRAPGTTGVVNAGHGGIVVRNGTVQEFDSLARLDQVRRNAIVGVTFRDGVEGVSITGSQNAVALSSFGEISHTGLSVVGNLNLVAGNTLGPADPGLFIGGSRALVIGNQLSGNGLNGALSVRATFGLFRGNRITGNSLEAAVQLTLSSRNVFQQNLVASNEVGMTLVDSDDNTIRSNRFVDQRGGDGLAIDANSDRNLVLRNVASNNRGNGIHTDNPTTFFRGNVANDNGQRGIDAPTGAVDGGGNRAAGNGDPAECLGVVCN